MGPCEPRVLAPAKGASPPGSEKALHCITYHRVRAGRARRGGTQTRLCARAQVVEVGPEDGPVEVVLQRRVAAAPRESVPHEPEEGPGSPHQVLHGLRRRRRPNPEVVDARAEKDAERVQLGGDGVPAEQVGGAETKEPRSRDGVVKDSGGIPHGHEAHAQPGVADQSPHALRRLVGADAALGQALELADERRAYPRAEGDDGVRHGHEHGCAGRREDDAGVSEIHEVGGGGPTRDVAADLGGGREQALNGLMRQIGQPRQLTRDNPGDYTSQEGLRGERGEEPRHRDDAPVHGKQHRVPPDGFDGRVAGSGLRHEAAQEGRRGGAGNEEIPAPPLPRGPNLLVRARGAYSSRPHFRPTPGRFSRPRSHLCPLACCAAPPLIRGTGIPLGNEAEQLVGFPWTVYSATARVAPPLNAGNLGRSGGHFLRTSHRARQGHTLTVSKPCLSLISRESGASADAG